MPIRDAKIASFVFGETVEAFAERFVINFLPESEQPLGRRRFPHDSGYPSFSSCIRVVILLFLLSGVAPPPPIWARSDPAAITSKVSKVMKIAREGGWRAISNSLHPWRINS